MILEWLELRDFRSYAELDFVPDPGINLLVGENGAGKTNLLEGASYLSRLRSFRRVGDDALIRMDAPAAIVRGEFSRDGGSARVEVEIPVAGRRRVQVNGKRPRRNADVRESLRVVSFLPDDLELVKGAAGIRRRLLDDLSVQLRPGAELDVKDYEGALRQRNALLRNEGRDADPVSLDAWDEELADAGSRLAMRRMETMAAVGPLVVSAYSRVAAADETVRWDYRSRWRRPDSGRAEMQEELAAALAAARGADMERRVTTIGPHRDEPALVLEGRDSRTQASEGEQRSLVLALRMAAFELLEEEHRDKPVLVLDDVFSELDANRSAALVEVLPGAQVLITTAREEDVPVTGTRWEISPGAVT